MVSADDKYKLHYELKNNTCLHNQDKLKFFTFYYLHLKNQFLDQQHEQFNMNNNSHFFCYIDKVNDGNRQYTKLLMENFKNNNINISIKEINSQKCKLIQIADLLTACFAKIKNRQDTDNKYNKTMIIFHWESIICIRCIYCFLYLFGCGCH